MNRDQFYEQDHVNGFIDWAVGYLPYIHVSLNISRNGTGRSGGRLGPGVEGQFYGLDEITNAYFWLGDWTDDLGNTHESGNWNSTHESLGALGQWIKKKLRRNDHNALLNACRQVLAWGGDRNQNVGAGRFLTEIGEFLQEYLSLARNQLSLDQADTNALGGILDMNAMLTKVHALISEDGLPIYDSRVAAAAGCLGML